jgi:hypothetical protein
VNVLSLYRDLKQRGVILEADGNRLKVNAPTGILTKEDREALFQAKTALLKMLSPPIAGYEDDGRRFDARLSRHPGYTSLYDPVHDEWHDFPTKDCYPSIITLANKRREKGGAS